MTLPGDYYTSEELFQRETEAIFLREWIYAGHISEMPEAGDHLVVEIDTESCIVARDEAGRLHASHNVCRHRGARLCQDRQGNFPGAIQCPYHAWTYELDGTLRVAPNMEHVIGFQPTEYPLHPLAVDSFNGLIFVSFASSPRPFEEAFASVLGKFDRWRISELRSVHQTVYEVEANWKLFFQNYSECYHCPNVHPVLNKLTPYRDSINDLEEGPILGGPMRLAEYGGSMTMSGRTCAAPLGEITEEDRGLVYYYTFLPNMFLSLHPDYVLVHRAEPLAVDRTRVHCDWYFHPDAIQQPGFDPSGAVEFWDMTNRQDWELCTISQRGISSRAYAPGPYSDLESQLAAFDREYLRLLAAAEGDS